TRLPGADMNTLDEQELKLRAARLQGAEQGFWALKEATLDLERCVVGFADDIRRLEAGQIRALRWTVGSILALGLILGGSGCGLLLGQAAGRRALASRLAATVAVIEVEVDAMARAVGALAARAEATERAA